jgi:hypothetical protein
MLALYDLANFPEVQLYILHLIFGKFSLSAPKMIISSVINDIIRVSAVPKKKNALI